MKIKLENNNLNIYNALRNAGYSPDKTSRGKISFSRSLLGARYPRFHIYFREEARFLDLHLDHKSPQYKLARDHGADYNGELVKKEKERIEKIIFTKK